MAYAPGIAVPPTSFYRNQSRLEPGGFIPHNPNKINVITAKVLIDGTGAKPLLNPVVVTEGAKIKIVAERGSPCRADLVTLKYFVVYPPI